ncbi:DUF4352 domain-containing protein [Schleiferilactobacillus perolens]|uniref:DUF4352 domain-containing protein n=1 Tax=Schleiferilactobacillus perolens DSM 12744 TaxID=1423792 RepID=A0A0R1N607_9LACO|nr:DUF4352 domain-containing protein [Schleiferilactobacillus perolens]KRL13026.1 hypothetical protein FD09_GL002566 [Schleiferilactobacillus perolens DSM 12744]
MEKFKHLLKTPLFWVATVLGVLVIIMGVNNVRNSDKYEKMYAQLVSVTKQNTKLDKKNKSYEKIFRALAGGSSSSDSDDSGDDDDSSSADTSHSGDVGGTMEFKSGEKVTVNKIADDPSAPVHDMAAGEHPVAVTVTVENTKSTPLSFNAQNFDLYDGQKEIGDFNAGSYSNNIPNSIAAGMKATMTIYFGAKNNGPYSVTFGDYTWVQK